MQSNFPCSPDNIASVNETFLRLVEETKKPGNITDSDWKRVREPALETYRVNMEKNNYWLSNLQTAYLYGIDPNRILTVEERLNAITPAKLCEIANKYFKDVNIFTGYWLPENK